MYGNRVVSDVLRIIKSQLEMPEELSTITLNKYFKMFLVELMKLFYADRILLENKGSLIIR